ncbi:MAG: NAD(+) synthase, partial [Candidatus Thiodiazotropha taylori]
MQSFSERYEAEVLNFDREQAAEHICETMRELLRSKLRKRGLVVAVSGGIDSSVSAALAVRAIGPKKCFFMQLPEVDSAEDTQSRSSQLIQHLGVESTQHNIASTLEAI